MVCTGCGKSVRFWTARHMPRSTRLAGSAQISARGALVLGEPACPAAVYCAACSLDIDVCEDCGCTPEHPCHCGCMRVRRGLCSSCARFRREQYRRAAGLAPAVRTALNALRLPERPAPLRRRSRWPSAR